MTYSTRFIDQVYGRYVGNHEISARSARPVVVLLKYRSFFGSNATNKSARNPKKK